MSGVDGLNRGRGYEDVGRLAVFLLSVIVLVQMAGWYHST